MLKHHMSEKRNWRIKVRTALERYFLERSQPRFALGLVLVLTGAFGLLISVLLLRMGVWQMWIRYPVAVLGAYMAFLGLLRAWVEFEWSRFDPQEPRIKKALNGEDAPRSHGASSSDSKDSWLDRLDFGSLDSFTFEGCFPIVLIGIVVGLIAGLFALLNAPVLLAEVFLDAFLVSMFYRRLRIATNEHWLGTAVRRTWRIALAVAALLGIAGWLLESMTPGAQSIGPAIHSIL